MEYVKYCDIINHLDVFQGDILYVTSDITSLAWSCIENGEVFNPDLFIDSIVNKVGPEGTVLFPTFNWDFSSYGKTFDYKNTPSQVGALTNVALKRRDFKRTQHPINSFAVWGNDQEYLCGLSNIGAYAADSPFGYFYEKKAKNLFIALDLFGISFIHHVEEMEGNPVCRFHKEFQAGYIDSNGVESIRTYSAYVRRTELCIDYNLYKMNEPFLEAEAIIIRQINGIEYRLIDLFKAYPVIANEIKNNKGKRLWTYIGQ